MPFAVEQYESLSRNVRRFLWLVDRIGAVLFWPTRLLRSLFPLKNVDLERIALVRCDGIGDLVNSIPAIHAVRKQFPDAQIDLVAAPWSRSVAEMIEGVDEVLIHAPWGYRVLRAVRVGGGLTEDLIFAAKMQRRQYDIAIDLRSDLFSLVPMAFWGIPRRIGRGTRGGGFAVTTEVAPVTPARQHEVDRTLAIVETVGAESTDRIPKLSVSDEDKERVSALFRQSGLEIDRCLLIAPGAQWNWRRWLDDRFAALCKRVAATGLTPVLIGAEHEVEHLESIRAGADGEAVNFAGKTSLRDLAAMFSGAAGFVAVESGPAAIASAVDSRGVVLFGPGIPEHFGPLREEIAIVARSCSAHPCYQRGDCCHQRAWCMAQIEVDDVWQALQQVLAK